jgi:hypothetical protein
MASQKIIMDAILMVRETGRDIDQAGEIKTYY